MKHIAGKLQVLTKPFFRSIRGWMCMKWTFSWQWTLYLTRQKTSYSIHYGAQSRIEFQLQFQWWVFLCQNVIFLSKMRSFSKMQPALRKRLIHQQPRLWVRFLFPSFTLLSSSINNITWWAKWIVFVIELNLLLPCYVLSALYLQTTDPARRPVITSPLYTKHALIWSHLV